ncbi:YcaO-like family protein [Antarctobacter sp.]|uniref:YcaO-like family protein n=1 Tax=Antarctobacter sp. TaxID=1872577 RepID=UPI003A94CBAC
MAESLIDLAETARLISKPSFAEFPHGAPIHVAFRFLELRAGTRPPAGAMARRVAFGAARTPAQAAQISGFEAIERYALQYCDGLPDTCESLLASDGGTHMVRRDALALGAPASNGRITSKGAAAGPTAEAAALRAVLECLEHGLDDRDAYTHVLPPEVLPSDLTTWLDGNLRKLEVHVAETTGIGLLFRAVCSDRDNGRPTYGTAFSGDVRTGVWQAASEAVVSWRNMVTLDFKGNIPRAMDDHEARLFHLYRGASTDRPIRPGATFDADAWTAPSPTLAAALSAAAKVAGRTVAVFDMTAADIPLPVIKALPIISGHRDHIA